MLCYGGRETPAGQLRSAWNGPCLELTESLEGVWLCLCVFQSGSGTEPGLFGVGWVIRDCSY